MDSVSLFNIYMDSSLVDLIYMEYPDYSPYILLLLGLFAAICLEGGLESLFYLIKGKRVGVTQNRFRELRNFIIFLILFGIFEYIIYYFGDNIIFRGIKNDLSDPFIPLGVNFMDSLILPKMIIDPIKVMFMFTLIGTGIYAILQIPYSIYLYIKRDKVRGKRALNRLFVLVLIGGILYLVFNKV